MRYGYDAVGNRLWERRLHDGDRGKRYAYDSAYRLLQTLEGTITSGGALGGPASTSETAAYDGVGNRVSLDRDGSVQDYVTNELNQYHTINGVTLTYDAGGSLRSSAEGAYAYDAFNRLRSASGSNGSIEYLYDARGRRVRAGAISFAYFESRAIEEYTDGAVSSTLVFGIGVDEVLMQRRPGVGALWNMEDVLGSVVAVADGSGVVERYRYESFGRPTFLEASGSPTAAVASAVGNRILFTGREFEAETGLYFYRARYYSPGMGRFLNRDPAGYVDGLNLYAYVRNGPTSRVDPTGLFGQAAGGFLYGLVEAAAEVGSGINRIINPASSVASSVAAAAIQTGLGVQPAIAPAPSFDQAVAQHDEFGAGRAAGHFTGKVTEAVVGVVGGVGLVRSGVRALAAAGDEIAATFSEGIGEACSALSREMGSAGGSAIRTAAAEGAATLETTVAAADAATGAGFREGVYDVGRAMDLRKNPLAGTQVNHAPASRQAESLVGGFSRTNKVGHEPSIRLPTSEHEAVSAAQAARTSAPASARELLAQEIRILRDNTNAPNSALQKLVEINKDTHPFDYAPLHR